MILHLSKAQLIGLLVPALDDNTIESLHSVTPLIKGSPDRSPCACTWWQHHRIPQQWYSTYQRLNWSVSLCLHLMTTPWNPSTMILHLSKAHLTGLLVPALDDNTIGSLHNDTQRLILTILLICACTWWQHHRRGCLPFDIPIIKLLTLPVSFCLLLMTTP